MAKVTVLISTIGERVRSISFPDYHPDVCYLVIHQEPTVGIDFVRGDISYIASESRGLSRSRNEAIRKCSTKYALVCDDDVEINVFNLLAAVDFACSIDVDILTCQFSYSDGQEKKYPKNGSQHNYRSLASVCSIELLVNVNSLKENSICFDERFGLGTPLPSGEEYVFLTDALKCSLNIRHCSKIVCVHPPVTSGMDFFSTKEKVLAKRNMIKRVFGSWAFVVMLIFLLKKTRVLVLERKFLFFVRFFFLK